MTFSASDRKSIRAAEKAARLAADRRASVTRSVMSTTEGREWMWDLLASCHIFATTFTPDPHQAAFSEGERNAGLRLLADIMLNCPDQFIQAQREANERSSLADVRNTADGQRRSGEEPDRGDSGRVDDVAYGDQAAADGNGYYTSDGDEAVH